MPKSVRLSYHHGRLRESLIAAGLKHIRRGGLLRFSLRSLAREAGVSSMAPYKHFKSKEEFFSALAGEGFRLLATHIREQRIKNPRNPRKQLENSGLAYIQMARENPELLKLMFGGGGTAPLCALSPDGDAFGELVQVVQNGQKAGLLQKEDPLSLAVVFWSAVHGLSVLVTSGALTPLALDTHALDKIIRKLLQALMDGLK